MNRQTLSWWRWRLRREAREAARPVFTELVVLPRAEEARRIRVHLGRGDAFVEVDEQTDLALLRDVLEALC